MSLPTREDLSLVSTGDLQEAARLIEDILGGREIPHDQAPLIPDGQAPLDEFD